MGIAQLKKTDGTIDSSSKEKTDVCNEFFGSVFIHKTFIPEFEKTAYNEPPLELSNTRKQVLKRLHELYPNMATGLDNISSRLLKGLSNVLDDPIVRIMNKSIEEKHIPTSWEKAHVVLIFKKLKGRKLCLGTTD